LEHLTDLGVEVRYPGTTADLEDAEEAMRTAQHVRRIVRTALMKVEE
jgi:thiazole synthase ThiGH ThiG subunit